MTKSWLYRTIAISLALAACQVPSQTPTSNLSQPSKIILNGSEKKIKSNSGTQSVGAVGHIQKISHPKDFKGHDGPLTEFSTKHLALINRTANPTDFYFFEGHGEYGGSEGWSVPSEDMGLNDSNYAVFNYVINPGQLTNRDPITNQLYPQSIITNFLISKRDTRNNGQQIFERTISLPVTFDQAQNPEEKGGLKFFYRPELNSGRSWGYIQVNYMDYTNNIFCIPYYAMGFSAYPTTASITIVPPENPAESVAKVRIQAKLEGTAQTYKGYTTHCPGFAGPISPVSFSMDAILPVPWVANQISCQKSASDSSLWYYDSSSHVPGAFIVYPNGTCSKCPPNQKRDPNNIEQCINACPLGETSNNHGDSCSPIVNPTPTPSITPNPTATPNEQRVCRPAENGGISCFSCPEGTSVIVEEGKPLKCSGGVFTESESMPFGVKGINKVALFEDLCKVGP